MGADLRALLAPGIEDARHAGRLGVRWMALSQEAMPASGPLPGAMGDKGDWGGRFANARTASLEVKPKR